MPLRGDETMDMTEANLTDVVLERFAETPDPRLRKIIEGLVRHVHSFVRDIEPTFDEWMGAIAYLTRVGQTCTPRRQEFILLSDVLGVSMLVDAINHRMPAGATETTVLGPFYLGEHRVTPNGADISNGAKGVPLFADFRIGNVAGAPIAGATVDVWHSDSDGFYDVQHDDYSEPSLRARFITSEDGRVFFKSIVPTFYPIPNDGPVGDLLKATKRHPFRPAHLHVHATAPGYEPLITHVFVRGDKYLESDAVFGVKDSLVADFAEGRKSNYPDGSPAPAGWRLIHYDFGLKAY
jgi:hydroxyquinol 1,2-dioxygenase